MNPIIIFPILFFVGYKLFTTGRNAKLAYDQFNWFIEKIEFENLKQSLKQFQLNGYFYISVKNLSDFDFTLNSISIDEIYLNGKYITKVQAFNLDTVIKNNGLSQVKIPFNVSLSKILSIPDYNKYLGIMKQVDGISKLIEQVKKDFSTGTVKCVNIAVKVNGNLITYPKQTSII